MRFTLPIRLVDEKPNLRRFPSLGLEHEALDEQTCRETSPVYAVVLRHLALRDLRLVCHLEYLRLDNREEHRKTLCSFHLLEL